MRNIIVLSICLIFSVFNLEAQALEERYILHGDLIREYLVYIPASYNPDESSSLIFVLHGFGSSHYNMQGIQLNAYAETNGYIIAYPQAMNSELSYAWNCGIPLNREINDVGLMDTLIDVLSAEFNIDERRVYACGFSLGGMMSQRLACDLGHRLAAVASVCGPLTNLVSAYCNPNRDFPVLYFHGTGDAIVSYWGDAIIGSSSVDATLNKWKALNECSEDISIEQVPDSANTTYHVEKHHFGDCSEGDEIVHYKIYDWPHSWPLNGSNINATDEIVKFFDRHVLPEVQTPTIVIDEKLPQWLSVGPNPFSNAINIEIQGNHMVDNWSIYTANGQLVKQGYNIAEIETNALQKGFYLMVLNSKDKVYTVELLKQ